MAESNLKSPGRLGVILLVLASLFAALLFIKLASSGEPGDPAAGEAETLATQAATPDSVRITSEGGADGYAADQQRGTESVNPQPAEVTTFTSAPGGTVAEPEPPAPQQPAAGAIYGSVSGEETTPLAGVTVNLMSRDGEPTGRVAFTNGAGAFSFQVPAGQYKLYFQDTSGRYLSAWYGGPDAAGAALIDVPGGGSSTVRQSLRGTAFMGSVAGTARDADGNGVAAVNVYAFMVINCATGAGVLPCETVQYRSQTVTDAGGAYRLPGLAPGSYLIFFAPEAASRLAHQWFRGQPTLETAKRLLVNAGRSTNDVDAELYRGGAISGRITRSGGQAAPGARVDIRDAAGIIVFTTDVTASGLYKTQALPEGRYYVSAQTFVGSVWTEEWYDGKSSMEASNAVFVARGVDRPGVNIDIGEPVRPAGVVASSPPHASLGAGDGVIPLPQQEQGATQAGDAAAGVESGGCASGEFGTAVDGQDVLLVPDEDEEQVSGDGGDDEADIGEVEGDGLAAA